MALSGLTGPATIAVSSDAFMGVGDTAELRFGSTSSTARIVAVYDRGLGFGDFIVLSSSLPASVQPTSSDLLLAQGSGAFPGLSVSSVDDYVDATVAGAVAQQQLGAILQFVLIFFVAIAAANTLVMLTRARSAEFALLRRIGATRRQLASMIAIEAGFVMALATGTLAVLPALTGVAYGLLGGLSVRIDWTVYAGLSAAVVVIAGFRWWGLRGLGGVGEVEGREADG